ncbi:hypothetical protein HPB52_003440 [Rhipicephalus sanguineus]|uniref:Uncharacterized protein n=1 Tax=Rhipicephalus sanguineus TaxID=34632 RepID=A0A9D4QHN1_RHISA|nr:hypothetical protein HPB52_003440 [Rhipicephalus sanguineus]
MFLEVLRLDVQLLGGYHHPGTLAGNLAGKQTGMFGETAGKLGGSEAPDDQGPAAQCGAELGIHGALEEVMLGHWLGEAALLMA